MHFLRRVVGVMMGVAIMLPLSTATPSNQVVLSASQANLSSIHASCTLVCDATEIAQAIFDHVNVTTEMLPDTSVGNEKGSTSGQSDPSTEAVTSGQSTLGGVWNFKGNLFGTTAVRTYIPPAVVNHDGQLVVLYSLPNASNIAELYFAFGDNDGFGPAIKFIDDSNRTYSDKGNQAPALASLLGDLHAVLQLGPNLVHFIYNDTSQIWKLEAVLTDAYSLPTLIAFNNALFLGVVDHPHNALAWATWTGEDGWSVIQPISGQFSWGIPGFYIYSDTLYMAFAANSDGRQILIIEYVPSSLDKWHWAPANPPETTAYGVSATYGEETAFVVFQDNSSGNQVFVTVFDGSWSSRHEDTGQRSTDTPTMAILDGVVNLIFNSHDVNGNILWSQRPLTSYSLESWMSVLGDYNFLSSLSIPGTHDTAAVSNFVPTVGCQTMSIWEQLNAGIRYFDLRAGLMNNVPIMYHSFYPINPPFFLPLASVISDIRKWLLAHLTEAVIVQIKQDNDPANSTISFATAVYGVINSAASSWNLGNTIPLLKDVRGKIQLVRRYTVNTTAGEKEIGIDVSHGWQDNNPRFQITTSSGAHLVIQDQYEFDEALEDLVPDKFTVVNDLMTEAASSVASPMTWYINFASATHKLVPNGFWIMPKDIALGAWDIANFAFVPGVNNRLRYQLYGLPIGRRYGTILMDFPEAPWDDLITRIVASNM